MVNFKIFNSFVRRIGCYGYVEEFDVISPEKFRFCIKVFDLSVISILPSISISLRKFVPRTDDVYFILTFDITVDEIKNIDGLLIV